MANEPARPAIHLYDEHRRQVSARDWGRVHIEGDRAKPVSFWRRRWTSVGEGIRRERGGFGRG